jgi:hypothetical protein
MAVPRQGQVCEIDDRVGGALQRELAREQPPSQNRGDLDVAELGDV